MSDPLNPLAYFGAGVAFCALLLQFLSYIRQKNRLLLVPVVQVVNDRVSLKIVVNNPTPKPQFLARVCFCHYLGIKSRFKKLPKELVETDTFKENGRHLPLPIKVAPYDTLVLQMISTEFPFRNTSAEFVFKKMYYIVYRDELTQRDHFVRLRRQGGKIYSLTNYRLR